MGGDAGQRRPATVIAPALSRRAETLRGERAAYVVATVVRVSRPSSARPGDAALVLADGTIEGFVGGMCAEQSVRLHALRALETGEPLLLRIMPGDGDAPAAEGAVTVQNPCLSGGALEIFLEPVPVAPRVVIAGSSPIAGALVRIGAELGLDMAESASASPEGGDLACVVASQGTEDELTPLRRALDAGVPYVALVASHRRGAAVLAELGAGSEHVETPAGLAIDAVSPGEIALAILTRIVEVRRTPAVGPALDPDPSAGATHTPGSSAVATATDPVCGMTVAVTASTPRLERDGETLFFCCEGCRSHLAAH
jgi:xanthine dehydrogenase accessory factor